jgi:hypothetical protein
VTGQKGHPLSGADHFHLLIDRQMRQKGLPGNISRIHLQLAPDADLHALKQRLEHDPTLRRVHRLRIQLRWPLMPRWEEDATTDVPPVVLHPVLSPQEFDLAVMNAPVPPRHCLVRIDLATQTDGSHHAVIAMHHALFDHRGMMLFLAALDSGTAPAQFFAPEAATSTWADMAAAFRATLFALASGGRRLATLVNRHTRPTATVRYHNLHLTAEETAQADRMAHQCGAATGQSALLMAAITIALRETLALRGQQPPYFWIPTPHDMRKKGTPGHLVGNALSFFYFRPEAAHLRSLPEAVQALQQQLHAQVRQRSAHHLAALLRVFRRVPLPLVDAMVGLTTGGRVSSFVFSDLGAQRMPMAQFCGISLLGMAHCPPVPSPPGLSVVAARDNGRLHLVLAYLPDALSTTEVSIVENRFRTLVISGL